VGTVGTKCGLYFWAPHPTPSHRPQLLYNTHQPTRRKPYLLTVGIISVGMMGVWVGGEGGIVVGGVRVEVEMRSVCNPSYRLSESCLLECCPVTKYNAKAITVG